jgi:MFS family permease
MQRVWLVPRAETENAPARRDAPNWPGCVDALHVGVLATATLLGSALLTLAVGFTGVRRHTRALLIAASLLMVLTGLGFAAFVDFWPLLVIAFFGTLNPSSGDVSVFLPLEHALLAGGVAGHDRTTLFARYSLVGALLGAAGTLLAALPELAASWGVARLAAFKAMFVLYTLGGLIAALIYRRLGRAEVIDGGPPPSALGPSRWVVYQLAALFSLDAFAGGLVVQSLLALWLFQTFGLSLAVTAQLFFWSGLLTAVSYLAAAPLARRIRLDQHHGVHPFARQPLPGRSAVRDRAVAGHCLAAAAQSALADGRANAHVLRHGRSHAGRAAGRGQPDGGAAQPRLGAGPEPCGLDGGRSHFRLAATARRRLQDRLRLRAARPLPAHPSARGAAAVITAGKDAVRPRVPRGHKLAAVGRDDPLAPAAAPETQTVSDCRHAAGQPIVAHCARVRARENGDGERSKEEQPRGQKAQGQQEERSRVDRHCVQGARQTEAGRGDNGEQEIENGH